MKMKLKNVFALGVILPVLVGCGGSDPAAENEPGPQVFEVDGRVVGIPAEPETLVIDHEAIPGFMPAMTMPFYLGDPKLADGLMVGDAIRFKYVVEERRSWIESIQEIDPSELTLESGERLDLRRQRLSVPRLEPGDTVPAVQLVNQEGESFSLADFQGKMVVLTFIFTRCPVPDFCPRMSHQFQEIQKEAAASEALRDRFHLLSITIDPEYDKPDVLARYAKQFTDDLSTWSFATGSPDRIDELTTRFAVFNEENAESGTIDHALATALIDPSGELVKIWRGNAWKPDEVIAAMREIAEKADPVE